MIPAGGTFTSFLAETAIEAGKDAASERWASNVTKAEDETRTVQQSGYDKTQIAVIAALSNHGHFTQAQMKNNNNEVYSFFESGIFDPSALSDPSVSGEFEKWYTSGDLPEDVVNILAVAQETFGSALADGKG